jgi:hypothetical protein
MESTHCVDMWNQPYRATPNSGHASEKTKLYELGRGQVAVAQRPLASAYMPRPR